MTTTTNSFRAEIERIANDYEPASASQAILALEEMRQALREALAHPDHSGGGGEFEVLGHMSTNGIERCKANRGGAINSRKTRECDVPVFIRSAQAAPVPQDGDEQEELALELTVEFSPKHEYRDPDTGENCFSALGFARNLISALASNKAAAVAVGEPQDDDYPPTEASQRAARFAMLQYLLRKIILVHEAGDKARTPLHEVIKNADNWLKENGLSGSKVRLAATPPAPIASAEEAALRDAVAYLNGNLPDGPIDQLRKARAIAAVMQAAAHPAGAQPSTSTEESVPKPKPFEKRPITEEWCMNMARLEGDSEIGACNPLKYPRIFVDSAIPGDPIEMALCSTEQVFLKPNQLYRFYVKESCAECSRIADPVAALVASSSEAIGWTTQFDLDCVNRGETGVIFKHKDQADSNIALYTHPAAAQLSRAQVLETRELPPLHGVSRVADNPCALMLLLKREPTDDDLREIHDALAGCALKDKS